jgi:stringent starvation protein B
MSARATIQQHIETLHAANRCVRIHINALAPGVVCPDFIRDQWQERLIIDLESICPLNLSFYNHIMEADLSFGGYVTRCTFPWAAIYVVADQATGRGIVLDQNMPETVPRSRHAPTTGPLPSKSDLKPVFDPAETPAREARPVAQGEGSPDGDAVKRRRAAFKVIDGG